MTASPETLVGTQAPRVLFRPEYTTERRGVEAVELAAEVGLVLDPWQELAVRVALAERADGKFAATEVGVLVARQNGKGAILEALALEALFLAQDPLVLWTSHEFKTSQEAFLRVRALVEGSDWLRRQVKRITASHGEERVELKTGPRLRWIARSKSSGRGFSPQKILFDESQELATAAIDALTPAMRAQPNRQSIYTGTVPSPEANHPEHWTRVRDRGRAGRGTRLAWMEWSPEGSEDPVTAERIQHTDVEVLRAANPGLGYRIDAETLLGDAESMDPGSFAREALSVWPTLPGDDQAGPVSLEKWAARAVPDAKPRKRVGIVLSVEVPFGRKCGWIGLCGPAKGTGLPVVAVYTQSGTDWIAGYLLERLEKRDVLAVVVDPGGPTGFLLPELRAAGIDLELTNLRGLGHATGGFIAAVEEARVAHLGQVDLDEAVKGAKTRMVGDVEVWDRKESSGVAPLVAVSLAFGSYVEHSPEDYDPVDSIA